jgi:hypothetical protein
MFYCIIVSCQNSANRRPPIEFQEPPVLSTAEAEAVLQARQHITDNRIPEETGGDPQYSQAVMGVTHDGQFISVERKTELRPDPNIDGGHRFFLDKDAFVIRSADSQQARLGTRGIARTSRFGRRKKG